MYRNRTFTVARFLGRTSGRMHIVVLRTDEPVGFITSDDPCVWMDPDANTRPPLLRSPNVRSRDFELTMPISPQQIVMLNWQISAYATANQQIVDELNRRTRYHCDETFIVCRNETRDAWF